MERVFPVLVLAAISFLCGADVPGAEPSLPSQRTPRFHTWYMINCEEESTWEHDFKEIRDTGFDCVTLWNVIPSNGGWWDFTEISRNVPMTRRAIAAAHAAGLKVFLGIWNPSNMGVVQDRHRLVSSQGTSPNQPNIYSESWQQEFWVPYLQTIRKEFATSPGYTGIVFDDATACTDDARILYSYSAEDEVRFSQYLEKSYGSIASFNLQYRRSQKPATSFTEIKPPKSPLESAKLWKDWTLARGVWSGAFAELTRETIGAESEIVYIDYDYYIDRSHLAFGHNTRSMMQSFDFYGPYIAQEFLRMSEEDLLRHLRRVIAQARDVCPKDKLHFCTWLNGLYLFEPMPKELVQKVVQAITSEGIDDVTLYAYKVHDWRGTGAGRGGPLNRLPLKELSFKYHPEMLEAIKEAISASRSQLRAE